MDDQKTNPEILTFEQFASQNGAARADLGERALDMGHTRQSPGQRRRQVEAQSIKDNEWLNRRCDLHDEYEQLIAEGMIRPPSRIEHLIETAQGHPDNKSVQAARRILVKHQGYEPDFWAVD